MLKPEYIYIYTYIYIYVFPEPYSQPYCSFVFLRALLPRIAMPVEYSVFVILQQCLRLQPKLPRFAVTRLIMFGPRSCKWPQVSPCLAQTRRSLSCAVGCLGVRGMFAGRALSKAFVKVTACLQVKSHTGQNMSESCASCGGASAGQLTLSQLHTSSTLSRPPCASSCSTFSWPLGFVGFLGFGCLELLEDPSLAEVLQIYWFGLILKAPV